MADLNDRKGLIKDLDDSFKELIHPNLALYKKCEYSSKELILTFEVEEGYRSIKDAIVSGKLISKDLNLIVT